MFIFIYYFVSFMVYISADLAKQCAHPVGEIECYINDHYHFPHLHYFIVILLFLLFLLPMMANGMVVNKSVGSRPNVTGFAVDWGE